MAARRKKQRPAQRRIAELEGYDFVVQSVEIMRPTASRVRPFVKGKAGVLFVVHKGERLLGIEIGGKMTRAMAMRHAVDWARRDARARLRQPHTTPWSFFGGRK